MARSKFPLAAFIGAVVVAVASAVTLIAVLSDDDAVEPGADSVREDQVSSEPAPAGANAPAPASGITWESMGGPPGAGRVEQLIQTTDGVHILFMRNAQGVSASRDHGSTWAPVAALAAGEARSIAVARDTLITCSSGSVIAVAPDESSFPLGGPRCDTVAAGDGWLLAAAAGRPGDFIVAYANDVGPAPTWHDISPAPDELGELAGSGTAPIAASHLLVAANHAFAAFGAVEQNLGAFYRRELPAGRWERISLSAPDGVFPASLSADPTDPSHIYATFQHPRAHEPSFPLEQMAFESVDGGVTWSGIRAGRALVSNAVTDVVRIGPALYVLCPYNGYTLRQDGEEATLLGAAALADFPNFAISLESLIGDRLDPNVVYGVPGRIWEFGLLRSTDGMATWHKMDRTIVASSPTIVVPAPSDASTVYTSGNILQEAYATRDGGRTWEPFSPVAAGDELQVDPHDPDHLILVDETTALFESFDGGRSFRPLAPEFSGAKILDFELASGPGGDVIYASILGVGISMRSAGEWAHMSGSPDYVYDLEIDPTDHRVIVATNAPKKFEHHSSLWRYSPDDSENFGWTEVLRIENSAGFTSIRFAPSDPDTIYAGLAGAAGTIYVSRDHGRTWSVLNPTLTFTTLQGHSQLEVDPRDPDTVYAATWGGGAFRSTDRAASWSVMDRDHTFSATCLVAAPSDPDILYACDRTAPLIHRSTDGGATWSVYFDFGADHLTTTAVAVDPHDSDVIYAAAFRPPIAMLGSFYRIEGGERAIDLGASLPRAVIEIEIDPLERATIYVTTHLHGLFKSDDGGRSWTQLDDQGRGLPRTGFLDVEVDPTDSRRVYASSLCGEIPDDVIEPALALIGRSFANLDGAAKCGLYRSTDGGTSWELVQETRGQAKGVDLDPDAPANVYLADSAGGIWVSADGGTTWREENEGLGSTTMTGVRVLGGRIYASTQGAGVFAGTINLDGGVSWEPSLGPRVYVYRVQIELDPINPNRLYASSYPGGVFRSDDGGATWVAKNFLTPSIRVIDPAFQGYYALEIDPADPETVWLGVYGRGLIVSHDGRDSGFLANGADQVLRGKHITSVQVDPTDSDHVFVGAEEGVFVTEDGGASWAQANEGLAISDVRSVRVSTQDLTPVVVDFDDGTAPGFELAPGWSVVPYGGGMALEGDGHAWARGGAAWKDYVFESEIELRDGPLHVNARLSDEGRYFIAVAPDGVSLRKQFRRWAQFSDVLAASSVPLRSGRPHQIAISLMGGRVEVAVDGDVRIDYVDPDPLPAGGIAFESLESPVIVDNVAVRPLSGGARPYIGTAGYGLYRFDTDAGTWRHLGRPTGFGFWVPWDRRLYQFSSIRFDPDQSSHVFYGHFPGGFFVSDDGGETWHDSSVGLGDDGIFSLAIHPSEPSVLFAGTYNGVVKSEDGGRTWRQSSTGMPPEQWPYTVAIDDDDPSVMYAATKNGQHQGFCERNAFCGIVVKSTDGGATWAPIMSGLDARSEFYTLLIYPNDHRVLFVSTSNGVFMSPDAGESWQPMNDGLPSTFNQVRDNVADDLTFSADHRWMYLGLVHHGVWRADLAELNRQ